MAWYTVSFAVLITVRRHAIPLQRAGRLFAAVLLAGLLHSEYAYAQTPDGPLSGKIEEQAHSRIEAARKLKAADQPEEAIAVLQQMIAGKPLSAQIPHAYWLLGQILAEMNKPDEAGPYFRRLLEEYPASELMPRARLALASSLLATGQPDTALPLLLEARVHTLDKALLLTIHQQFEEAYLAKQDHMHAAESAVEAGKLASGEARNTINERVRHLITSTIGAQDLRRMADKYGPSFPADAALLRLIELHGASGEDYQVSRAAREFLGRFAAHEKADRVAAVLAEQQKILRSKTHHIGVLLPLSGPLSPYGVDVLNGIRLALEVVTETSPSLSVGLVAKDTEGDATGLARELDDLLNAYHPIAVIGPLLSRDVKAVAPFADAHEVVFITPTATVQDVQRFGRYLFNAAVNNRALLRDLVTYATGSLGWTRFCILASQDTYGREMARTFAEEISRHGGEIIASDFYEPDDTDLALPIKRLKDADLKQQGRLEKIESPKKGKRDTRYHPGFDAMFLPGDAEKVGLIAGQVRFYAASVGMLGTNGMNSPELLRLDPRGVEGAVFADSFSIAGAEPSARHFVERYTARFQRPPSSFAAQSYEAATLILDALRKGAVTGRHLRERLQTTTNAPGLIGPLTVTPEGHLERRHVILQVKNGKFVAATTAQ